MFAGRSELYLPIPGYNCKKEKAFCISMPFVYFFIYSGIFARIDGVKSCNVFMFFILLFEVFEFCLFYDPYLLVNFELFTPFSFANAECVSTYKLQVSQEAMNVSTLRIFSLSLPFL